MQVRQLEITMRVTVEADADMDKAPVLVEIFRALVEQMRVDNGASGGRFHTAHGMAVAEIGGAVAEIGGCTVLV